MGAESLAILKAMVAKRERTMAHMTTDDRARSKARKELPALREVIVDCERYAWLREQCSGRGKLTIARYDGWDLNPWSGDDPDGAIDDARKGEGHE